MRKESEQELQKREGEMNEKIAERTRKRKEREEEEKEDKHTKRPKSIKIKRTRHQHHFFRLWYPHVGCRCGLGSVTASRIFPTSNVTGHVSAVQNSQDPGFLAHPQHPLRNTKYILCLAKQISIELSQQS